MVNQLAWEYQRTPAQVLIRWAIRKGLAVITKSTQQPRIEGNFDVFDFDLDETTMSALDSLDTTGHTDAAMEKAPEVVVMTTSIGYRALSTATIPTEGVPCR